MKLLHESDHLLRPEDGLNYLEHDIVVPADIRRLRVSIDFEGRWFPLFLTVRDPRRYRGTCIRPAAMGGSSFELDLSEAVASRGGIRGAIPPGTWRVMLDVYRQPRSPVPYRVRVEAAIEAPAAPIAFQPPANGPVAADPRYFRGELHAHSHHSDGVASVAELVATARQAGLDFLSLTDHFTSAGWEELERSSASGLTLIPGLEISGRMGDANLQGLSEWVDPFIDAGNSSGRTIEDAARETHEQGGLFCVNHPFSLHLGWRYQPFDWDVCDLLEIYHHNVGANNHAALGLWDRLLHQGHRVTGVGATDSHHPALGSHALGTVSTHVYAEEPSVPALLDGLRRGRAYVSLGPNFEFTASAGTCHAFMGQELPLAGRAELTIVLDDLRHACRVLLLKNGLYHAHEDVVPNGERRTLAFEDREMIPGYYRVEVHALTGHNHGVEWDATLVLSNPIYVV